MNPNLALHNITNENSAPAEHKQNPEFNKTLAQSLFAGDDLNAKVLAFKNKAPTPSGDFTNKLRVVYTSNKEKEAAPVQRKQRTLASAPERILDAPDMLDDYYLNLLDWSPATNSATGGSSSMLAVGLGSCVYLWDAATGAIDLLSETKDGEHVGSVSWTGDGSYLAIGTSNNEVLLWDVARKKQVRTMRGHTGRVSALAWNNHILSSGGR